MRKLRVREVKSFTQLRSFLSWVEEPGFELLNLGDSPSWFFYSTPWPPPAVLFLRGKSVLFSWASSGWSIVIRTWGRTPQIYFFRFVFAQGRHQCPWCGLVCCLGSFWLQIGIVLLDGDYILYLCYLIAPPWNLRRPKCPWYSLKAEFQCILEKGSTLSWRTGAPCSNAVLAYLHSALSKNVIFSKQ